jgi:hypothetical protein
MAKTVDANRMVNRWVQGMGSASSKYVDGINAFQGNPMALAATPQALQAYLAGVTASINNGKRARSLMNSDPNAWKANSVGVGAQRLASGAQKGKAKYAAQAQKWAGVFTQASAAAAAIGKVKGDIGNATARFAANLQVIMAAANS